MSAIGRVMEDDRQELAAIFAGGFLGTIARAALAESLAVGPGEWPWATFTVNILASLLLGYLVTRSREHDPHERPPRLTPRRAFLGPGVCAALSTFSTMMLELLRMIDGAHWMLAVGYAGASIACGLGAIVLAGMVAGRGRLGA